MAQTYGDCWRLVRLYVPAAPLFLCREWVNSAYKRLAAARPWSFLRGETALVFQDARTLVAIDVTQGSATVLSSAAEFLPADAGRQFRIGSGATYTILAYIDASTVTLDRLYADASATAQTALINDAYVVMPADFGSFRTVLDPYNQRVLPWWLTEDQLARADPARTSSDSGPRCLVAQSFSTYPPTLGQLRYEVWPRPTSARSYPVFYNKQAANLDDTSILYGVLADGANVLIDGALEQAALWPGTPDLKNPYFDRNIAATKAADFAKGVQALSLKDDAQYPDDLQSVNWACWSVWNLAYNDHALRASDATVAGYW